MCEYVCDMYSRAEDESLNFIRLNRRDPFTDDDVEPENYLDHKFLLRTFHGSSAWASEMVSRCHALSKAKGDGTFLITVTCNKRWPEIQAALYPGPGAEDQPDVVMRVWKAKLS
jgi:hypothetical protein